MNFEREWMYKRTIDGWLNVDFVHGLEEFLRFAESQPNFMDEDKIRCPCSLFRCQNRSFFPIEDVRYHVLKNGFVENYFEWTSHGERWGNDGCAFIEEEDSNATINLIHGDNGGRYHEMVIDGFGVQEEANYIEEEPNPESKKMFDMLRAANQELFPGCEKHSQLSAVARMFNMKAEHHFSERCFDQLSEFIKELLPNNNVFPDNFYQTKRLIDGLGLPVQQIDCCVHNCMLFWDDDAELQACKFCQHPRFKLIHNSRSKQAVQKPYRKMHYFPLTPRLQRLYASEATAKHMRWHAEHKYEEGVMRHPSDSPAWKHFNDTYPSFQSDTRNVMVGLSTDGFQPFTGHVSEPYSSWPIFITPYNIPPWMCMKREYMFLTVIVPGPSNPKWKIDVFLQPLIKELHQLWDVGAPTYDVSRKQNFVMCVALLWTVSDFPAKSMLSGWSTGGRLACPYCMEYTDAFYLTHGGKHCWFDNHRKFLSPEHPWRRNKTRFRKNKIVNDVPPPLKSGQDILHEIESLGLMKVTEVGSDEVNSAIEKNGNKGWKKRSIFWDLPYWSSLLIRHNLDVMHIEKNFFDNLFNTIMNIDGKTKDNAKARKDMQDICRRPELMINDETGKYPKAIYCLEKDEKQAICNWMSNLRFPDGYVSNMARRVNMRQLKLFGLKSHDCHVFMQRLLPIAFRELLPRQVWEALTEISIFFKQLTNTVLREQDMRRLELEIPLILCKLEGIFPPGFFNSQEHLPIHLPFEARIGGPVQYRWMYPFERRNGDLKKNVKNKAHVEGSIANAYLVEEASSFCSHYFEPHVVTRHDRVPRNDDCGFVEGDDTIDMLSIFNFSGRPMEQCKRRMLTKEERDAAHSYVLLNCEEVSPFVEIFTNEIRAQRPTVSSVDIDALLEHKFPEWFYSFVHISANQVNNEIIKDFARGPYYEVKAYSGYYVNGYKFHTEGISANRKTINSGVCIKGSNYSEQSTDYYGKLLEVLELEYPAMPIKRTVVFLCQWFDPSPDVGTIVHPKYNLVDVNRRRKYDKYEPFILAHQAQQVCYIPYPSKRRAIGDWLAVLKVKPRHVVDLPDGLSTSRGIERATALQEDDEITAAFVIDDEIDEVNGIDEHGYLCHPDGGEVVIPDGSNVDLDEEYTYSSLEDGIEEDNNNEE